MSGASAALQQTAANWIFQMKSIPNSQQQTHVDGMCLAILPIPFHYPWVCVRYCYDYPLPRRARRDYDPKKKTKTHSSPLTIAVSTIPASFASIAAPYARRNPSLIGWAQKYKCWSVRRQRQGTTQKRQTPHGVKIVRQSDDWCLGVTTKLIFIVAAVQQMERTRTKNQQKLKLIRFDWK